MDALRDYIVSIMRKKNLKIAFAESCTGGAMASFMTDFEGSSNICNGGVVVYNNQMKKELLGITIDEENNEYSVKCTEQMAKSIAILSCSDIGVAISARLPNYHESVDETSTPMTYNIGYLSILVSNANGENHIENCILNSNDFNGMSRKKQKELCIEFMLTTLASVLLGKFS